MNKGTYFASVFIVIGFLMLILRYILDVKFLDLKPEELWPFIVIGIGLAFESIYFVTSRNPSFLIPGGMLTVSGIVLLFEVSTNWEYAKYTWPMHIFSVGISLLQYYLFGFRNKGIYIPAIILIMISFIFGITSILQVSNIQLDYGLAASITIILLGVFILIISKNNKVSNKEQ